MALKPKTEAKAAPKKIEMTEEQFNTLMNRLSLLENSKTATTTEVNAPGTDQYGKPVGIFQKYSVDPADYQDPREQLYDLPELRRFAFKENYMLDWEVEQSLYDTKFGTAVSEPKFTLTLKQRRFDEDGNTKKGLIVRGRAVFFEDPAASIKEAVMLGLTLAEQNTPEFLSQMRFYRYKFWLMEVLSPRAPENTKNKIHEEVIAGKVYVIEDSQTVVE